jgi:hypothetical protein
MQRLIRSNWHLKERKKGAMTLSHFLDGIEKGDSITDHPLTLSRLLRSVLKGFGSVARSDAAFQLSFCARNAPEFVIL